MNQLFPFPKLLTQNQRKIQAEHVKKLERPDQGLEWSYSAELKQNMANVQLFEEESAQLAFTCSKLTIETLE